MEKEIKEGLKDTLNEMEETQKKDLSGTKNVEK